MEMPQLLDEHRKLRSLAGTWVGEEQIFPTPWDPKGGPATSRLEARIDLDGFFLVTDYVEQRGGRVSYRGHGVYGWSASERCYTMHWFDSIGSDPGSPGRGRWEDNTLIFEQQSPMGRARYTYTFEGDGRYTFRIEQSADGSQWATFMEGRYTRT